ncbi:MAG: Ig-like domain-containing protein, partial [Lachnospiraceae bacterium]|nr:Ig-like domain-containing protein [Lachnospiraceae bacterium]
EGEELPSPDDSKFVYDLPVSFEMSDSVLLFVNYDIDTTLETEERGTLVWSILRGEKGLKEGSASLVKEEDDWADFEVVSDSPYFTMTENDDEENAYYQAMLITAKDVIDHENNEDDKNSEDYNYYIRAAWYFGTEEEMDEDFYAAATIAFLPQEDTDIDEAQDDMIDTEEVDTDQIQDDEPVTEETVEEALDDALSEEEIDMDNALEDIGAERVGSEIFESDEQQDSNKDSRKLILDITKETMKPGETQQVNVTIESEDIQEDTQEDDQEEPQEDPSVDLLEKIVWASSNKSVATVEKGLITAEAEGYAQITAQYDGLTASVKIEVVQEENEKVLNLDGDIWIAGFKQESDDFVYTGQKITQDIRVYYDETLLQEKTDYTVTYKNNVNAAAYNSAKAPSMTIKLKGQYSGSRTLYFTIKPREIDENETMGYEQVVPYAKTLKIPAPTLYYNNKKLASGKDFVCDYTAYDESSAYKKMPADYKKGDSYEAGEIYEYTVNGAGNFTGSFKMQLVVVKDKNLNLANASVTLEKKQYEYHGTELTKADVKITAVKFGKVELAKEYYNYEVHAAGVGTGYIEITPTKEGRDNGYRGLKKVNFKVVGDRQIKDAKIKEAVIEKGVIVEDGWHSSITFSQKSVNEDGGMIQTAAEVLVYVEPSDAGDSLEEGSGKEVVLEEGKDYTVKYSNHKKVGTATATFTGKGRYKGTLKVKYQITPNIKEENFTIVWTNVKRNVTEEGETFEMAYQKGGAVPNFVLMDQDKNVLKNKTDYTVKVTDNKNVGTALRFEINGKGNYKGYQEIKSIMVTKAKISNGTISVADKQYSAKADAWKSKPTITDVNGKKLTAGTDYDKDAIDYYYEGMESGKVPGAKTIITV